MAKSHKNRALVQKPSLSCVLVQKPSLSDAPVATPAYPQTSSLNNTPPTQIDDSIVEHGTSRARPQFSFITGRGFGQMTAEKLLSRLESFDFENYDVVSYSELEFALGVTLCGKNGGFPIGQFGGHHYALHFHDTGPESINFRPDPCQTGLGMICHLHLEKRDGVVLKLQALPLGLLIKSSSQTEWIVVMTKDHSLLALHPLAISEEDCLGESEDDYGGGSLCCIPGQRH